MISSIVALGFKIFPLYINIFLGFLAGSRLGISREYIAPLIVYILAPAVVFGACLGVEIDAEAALVPLTVFALSVVLCLAALAASKLIWQDNTRNIIAFSAGTGNTGYFGIPLAYILLDEPTANLYVLALVMSFLYEYTIGFYIISRGTYTLRQSLGRLMRLPVLYAAAAGVACNLAGVHPSGSVHDWLEAFRGAYTTLGMMMVGMGLVGIRSVGVDMKFVGALLFNKFIIYPLAAIIIAAIDAHFVHLLSPAAYQVIFVYAIVPMAANTAIMATLFKTRPEQTSFAILVSTAVAFLTIPIMAGMFL